MFPLAVFQVRLAHAVTKLGVRRAFDDLAVPDVNTDVPIHLHAHPRKFRDGGDRPLGFRGLVHPICGNIVARPVLGGPDSAPVIGLDKPYTVAAVS